MFGCLGQLMFIKNLLENPVTVALVEVCGNKDLLTNTISTRYFTPRKTFG